MTHTPVYRPFVRDNHAGKPVSEKVKPIWILLKQETVSGSGISWAICKSAPHSRQITMPFLPPNQQRQSTKGTVLLYEFCRKFLTDV